jgi:outer membrane biosynthesis protein TonB
VTRRPFDPGELDGRDSGRDEVAAELERYAGKTTGEVPHNLEQRVMAAVNEEPIPRRAGILAALLAPFAFARGSGLARAAMIAGTAAIAVLAVVVAGELAGLFTMNQAGSSPSPTTIESPSSSPTSTPSPSPSISPSPTPTPSPVPTDLPATPTPRPSVQPTTGATAQPTESETPEPSDDDHSETPHPSEDNSGPGGGSDDSPG